MEKSLAILVCHAIKNDGQIRKMAGLHLGVPSRRRDASVRR